MAPVKSINSILKGMCEMPRVVKRNSSGQVKKAAAIEKVRPMKSILSGKCKNAEVVKCNSSDQVKKAIVIEKMRPRKSSDSILKGMCEMPQVVKCNSSGQGENAAVIEKMRPMQSILSGKCKNAQVGKCNSNGQVKKAIVIEEMKPIMHMQSILKGKRENAQVVKCNSSDQVQTATVMESKRKVCNECGASFSAASNLSRHKKVKHKVSAQTKTHLCSKCGSFFPTASSLSRHVREKHADDIAKRFQCTVCTHAVTSKKALVLHFAEQHNVHLMSEVKEFESEVAFFKWKEETEKEDMSSFVSSSGTLRRTNGTTVTYYSCHRSGKYNARGSNKRHLKMIGSNKIGKTCPAVMKVTREPQRIVVVYTSTHLGHSKDIGRLRLLPTEKALLAEKMAEGVTTGEIIETIQNTVNRDHRLSLTTNQDLRNIAQSVKLQAVKSEERTTEFNMFANEFSIHTIKGIDEEKAELMKMAEEVMEFIKKSSTAFECKAIRDNLSNIKPGIMSAQSWDAHMFFTVEDNISLSQKIELQQ